MNQGQIRSAAIAAVAGQILLLGAPAGAQQGGLEEIIVTSTRRELNLQDVPISVVAITGDQLEMRGMHSLENLTGSVPNLVVTGGLGGSTQSSFTVRGIPRVGSYLDGVWQVGGNGAMQRSLVELERVEVLRGPQGTLYGRDSTGGAIRLVTKRPAEEFGARLSTSIGSLDRRDVSLAIDLPLTDKLLTKWTAASLERDGYIDSLTVDQSYGRIDDTVLRGDVLWLPTDNLSVRFNYQNTEQSPTEPRVQDGVFPEVAQQFPFGPFLGSAAGITQIFTLAGAPITPQTQQAGFPGGQVGQWQTRSEITVPDEVNDEQLLLDVSWQLTDSLSLQSLTAKTQQFSSQYIDWDNTQYNILNDLFLADLDLFSQEFQLSGTHDRFNWVAGAYYWEQQNTARSPGWSLENFKSGQLNLQTALNSPQCQNPPPGFTPCQLMYNIISGTATDDFNWAQQRGWAAFGEVVIGLTDTLDLTVGYRHHDQTNKSQQLAQVPGVTAPAPARSNSNFAGGDPFAGARTGPLDQISFDKGTSRLALNYRFTDDVMGYVSYSEGFNSGGFSVAFFPNPPLGSGRLVLPFEPESLQSYELGLRSDLLDGLLRFNISVFHTIWDDVQLAGEAIDPLTGIVATTLVTTNVAGAEAEGLEVELVIVPTQSLLFNVNLGLLDTQYTDILTAAPPELSLNTEFAQAPETQANIGLQHTARLGNGGTFTSRVDYTYTDQFWRSQIPNFRTAFYNLPAGFDEGGDYGLVNARLTYAPAAANWELAVFGTNLTDEYYLNSGFFHSLWQTDFATVGRPREAGVSLKVSFD